MLVSATAGSMDAGLLSFGPGGEEKEIAPNSGGEYIDV